jgi:hypothetical protein
MKKIIWLAVSVMALATACERYVDLKIDGPENLLVVNGNLCSGDTLHTVYLSLSRLQSVRPVEKASLKCYVNGALVSETDSVMEYKYTNICRVMQFKADFKPGDEVKITVESGDCRTETVSTVPSLPEISVVDTCSVTLKDGGDNLKIHLKIRDVKGEDNYYRLIAYVDSDFWAEDVAPEVTEYTEGQHLERCSDDKYIDNTQEGLLYRKVGTDEDQSIYSYWSNYYNIFTDSQFADGEYTLSLLMSEWNLRNYYSEEWVENCFTLTQTRKLRFRVLSMSKQTYYYMNDYDFDHSDESLWSFISGIPYPSNVTGGTGMVSVMAPVDVEIGLDKIRYSNLYTE